MLDERRRRWQPFPSVYGAAQHHGIEGVERLHVLNRAEIDSESPRAELLGDRSFDDLFAVGSDRRFAISGGGRRLTVQLEKGYGYAQVYAPEGQNVVCLEPMVAATNALVKGGCPEVKTGNSYLARFSIRVESTES